MPRFEEQPFVMVWFTINNFGVLKIHSVKVGVGVLRYFRIFIVVFHRVFVLFDSSFQGSI
jgi:hypothetical protein